MNPNLILKKKIIIISRITLFYVWCG